MYDPAGRKGKATVKLSLFAAWDCSDYQSVKVACCSIPELPQAQHRRSVSGRWPRGLTTDLSQRAPAC